jgi:S-methylmethionine-dependent homocysteine/selenocysteine methylase
MHRRLAGHGTHAVGIGRNPRHRLVYDYWMPETNLQRKLAENRPVIIDGGTGAELQRRGVPASRIVWVAEAALRQFDVLVSVHADFIRAGAEVVTANTFATNRFVLAARGLGGEFAAINRAAVEAARQAVTASGIPTAIAGSMSCLPPAFDTANYPDIATERRCYRELAETLADLGVDLIALEMMQDRHHAGLALDAASRTGLPVWLGMSCRLRPSDRALVGFDNDDVDFLECLHALMTLEPAVINLMHSSCNAIDHALPLLRREWGGPVGIYPEVGSFDPITRVRSVSQSPEALAARCVEWMGQGARILGGCCGATPEHIRAIRSRTDRLDEPDNLTKRSGHSP